MQQVCDPDDAFTHEYGTGVKQPDGGRVWTCVKCGDVQTASAAFLQRLTDDRKRIFAEIAAEEKEQVRALGSKIGFGNVMHKASECWADEEHGQIGGHFLVGPCAAMTVPCDCGRKRQCDWCCGSGWLTEQVAALRVAATDAYHHFNADWIDDRKDGPVVRALGVALGLCEPDEDGEEES